MRFRVRAFLVLRRGRRRLERVVLEEAGAVLRF